jgi:hypothetical protein
VYCVDVSHFDRKFTAHWLIAYGTLPRTVGAGNITIAQPYFTHALEQVRCLLDVSVSFFSYVVL